MKTLLALLSWCSGKQNKDVERKAKNKALEENGEEADRTVTEENEEAVDAARNKTRAQQQHYIPEEIIAVILSKLPVKSILRFKCACKLWHSLISDSKFDFSTKGRKRAIISLTKAWTDPTSFYSLEDNQLILFEHLPDPVERWGDGLKFLGSCQGLLLFCPSPYLSSVADTFLWNPTTGCCRNLPQLNGLETIRDVDIFRFAVASGLCFDESSDDYKAVFFHTLAHHYYTSYTRVRVASLRKGVIWDDISFPYEFAYYYPEYIVGVLAHGHLHWLVRERSSGRDLIVYFDEKHNKFEELPMPEVQVLDSETTSYIIDSFHVLQGCLSMIVKSNGRTYYDVLIMEEYGVKESWTRLYGRRSWVLHLSAIEKSNAVLSLEWTGSVWTRTPHEYLSFIMTTTPLRPLCTRPRNAKEDEVDSYLTIIHLPRNFRTPRQVFTFVESLTSVH